ncbi:MAG: DUF6756 family protein [Ferruginibacter sp.]
MMGEVKDEIQNAIQKLRLDRSDIQLLDNYTGEKIFNECIKHFLKSGDKRWWWEDFKFPSSSVADLDNPFKYIDKIIPLNEGNVWLIVEDDDDLFYPVFDCNPNVIKGIIEECFGFEYYIIDKRKEWLLCENHHNRLIAIGEKLKQSNLNWQPD